VRVFSAAIFPHRRARAGTASAGELPAAGRRPCELDAI
jgi:hypothetical protein